MKPSREEFETALQAAERMRRQDLDPHHVAKVLRYLQARNESLEDLLVHADRLVRFGLAEQELTALKRRISRLREDDERDGDNFEIGSSMLL